MTDDFERRLTAELHEHTPPPRRELTADEVWARSGRSHSRALAVGGGVLIAAAVAVALVVFGSGRNSARPVQLPLAARSSPGAPMIDGRASTLFGRTWVLSSPEPGVRDAWVWIRFTRAGVVYGTGCASARVTIRDNRMTFSAPLRAPVLNCGWRGTSAQADLVHSMLRHTVRWALAGGHLTLTRPGHDSLTFTPARRSGAASFRISGRLLAVGGPAGTRPEPMPGTVTAVNVRTGSAYSARANAGGRYTVLVSAGKYRLVGQSPQYSNGDPSCQGPGPMAVSRRATTTANVICQRR